MKQHNQFFRALCFTVIYNAQLICAPGDLDTTFGTDGTVVTHVSRNDFITSCTVQADDSILVGGSANGYYQRTCVARYTPNGDLDTSFNTTGINIFKVGVESQGQAIALQANEKVLITGYAFEDLTKVATSRLNTDGTLDTSFNSTGSVTTQVFWGATGNSVVVQPDTNIVVGGLSYNSQSDFMLLRYDASGALDSGFGTGGRVTTSIDYGANINKIALQADGKIVAGGYSYDGSYASRFCLARYNTDGTIDTSFGTSGIVQTTIGTACEINSIAIQDDGYIVVAGFALDVDGITKFALARYDTDGVLDTNFNTTGTVITQIQYEAKAYSVLIQPNGQIVVGGYSYADLATQFALARYDTDGSIDTSFGTNGIALTTIGGHNSDSKIKSLAIQSNGDIIAAGESNAAFAIARYLAS